jgi:hypothetical protein
MIPMMAVVMTGGFVPFANVALYSAGARFGGLWWLLCALTFYVPLALALSLALGRSLVEEDVSFIVSKACVFLLSLQYEPACSVSSVGTVVTGTVVVNYWVRSVFLPPILDVTTTPARLDQRRRCILYCMVPQGNSLLLKGHLCS